MSTSAACSTKPPEVIFPVSNSSGEHLSEGINEPFFVDKTCSMSYPISVPVADRHCKCRHKYQGYSRPRHRGKF